MFGSGYYIINMEEKMKFYNLKLKKTVEVDESDVELVTMKNGRPAAKAEINIDGETYKVFKILSKDTISNFPLRFFTYISSSIL